MLAHFLNVRETAERLGVHENTIRNWESKGLLRAVHLPGSHFRRFDAADIERMRQEMRAPLAPAHEGHVIEPTAPIRGHDIMYGDLDSCRCGNKSEVPTNDTMRPGTRP